MAVASLPDHGSSVPTDMGVIRLCTAGIGTTGDSGHVFLTVGKPLFESMKPAFWREFGVVETGVTADVTGVASKTQR